MLTAKQKQLLSFIQTRLDADGVSPSFDEMKEALGLKSKSGVHRLVKALEERGFIRRLPNRARALEVVKTEAAAPADNVIRARFGRPSPRPVAVSRDASIEVPLHGRIAAGTPIEALEQIDTYVAIPPALMGRGTTFALEVSGDSMIDLGILDGDTVLIESCETAQDGDVVVALVDEEEATLKTLKRQGSHVALIPANRHYDTQILESHRVRVQGRLIGLLRRY
ncbi:MAG: transcriptional repressor LexA [Rhodothalassiaceae bacterium]